jgi:hypothetical protein
VARGSPGTAFPFRQIREMATKLSDGGQSYKRRLIVKPDPAVIYCLSPPPFITGASNAFILS